MSQTSKALLVKFLMTFVVAALAFRTLGSTWSSILFLAVAGTILNYLLGDLLILPAAGNLVASVADGGLAALTAYLIDRVSTGLKTTSGRLMLFAVLIAVGEYFFHRYLIKSPKVAP